MSKDKINTGVLGINRLLPDKMRKGLYSTTKSIRTMVYRVLPKEARYIGKVPKLTAKNTFPPRSKANKRIRFEPIAYLLAYGGDLSVDRMVEAVKQGVAPFFTDSEPYLWWMADERIVVFLDEIHIESSIRRLLKKEAYTVTVDQAYSDVLEGCRDEHEAYTWLTDDRIKALKSLHDADYSHSIEVWQDGDLVGGLFGFHMGEYFHIESFFYKVTNVSKYAFCALCLRLRDLGFKFCDLGHWPTEYLERIGGRVISDSAFINHLNEALYKDSPINDWETLFDGWDLRTSTVNYLNSRK